MRKVGVVLAAFVVALGWMWSSAARAADPAAVKVSSFAPAKYVEAQIEAYLEDVQEAVESETEYNDAKEGLVKDVNTLLLLALAAGLHDQDNKYKAAAPAMIEAAKKVLAATNYTEAKQAVAELTAAVSSNGDPSVLKWEKLAALVPLMEQVPLVNSSLKRYMRRFSRSPETIAEKATTLAVIAQGSMPNADETIKPSEVEKWHQFCVQMRDAAAELIAAADKKDEQAATAAMDKLQQSCEACHAVFHPEE